jgi:hypothetical protein
MSLEDRTKELEAELQEFQKKLGEMEPEVTAKGHYDIDNGTYRVSVSYKQPAKEGDIIPNNKVPFAVMQYGQADDGGQCNVRFRVSGGSPDGMPCLKKLANQLFTRERYDSNMDGETAYNELLLTGPSPNMRECYNNFLQCVGIYSMERNNFLQCVGIYSMERKIILNRQHKP